jgi:tape measure domain-containing protein|tara:strand:+ start:4650 stop:6968 length:2319 start_codon:yes stop_codon:yes gene_type:complete
MAIARVGVELVTGPAVAAAKKLQVSVGKVETAVKKLVPTNKRVEASFRLMGMKANKALDNVERSAKKAGRALGGLKGLIGGVAVGFLAVQAAQAGIARAESERRIKFLARSYGEMAELQAAATASAEKFGLGQTEANNALANTYARLRPVGVSLKDITSIYNGFNTVAKLSGATSVEASNAFTQLAQALGSGALRGDEFNSIAEQVPGLLTAISKETGVAQGALRKYAAEGKITSDVVLKALKRIETEGAGQLEEALGGPTQAIKEFQNATEDVQVALTQDIVPLLAEAFRGLAELIVNLEGPIRFIGGVAANTLNQINSLIVAATNPGAVSAKRDLKAGMLPLNVAGAEELFKGTGPGGKGLAGMRQESTELAKLRGQNRRDILLELMQNRLKTMEAPAQAPSSAFKPSTFTLSGIGDGTRASGGSTKAAKERLDITQRMFDLESRLIEAKQQGFEREEATLQLMIERQRIAESDLMPREAALELLQAEATFLEKIKGIDQEIADQRKSAQEDAQKAFKEFMEAEREAAQKRLEADPFFQMKKQLEELVKVENQVALGATAIGNAFASSFKSLINGSKSGKEALADMMSSIAEHFLDMAAQIIAQQIAMILYGTIMKALGVSMPGAGGGGGLGIGGGAQFGTPLQTTGFFADGGFVDKPTNAVIGEGSEPEYVIPESKMRESMARYSRGSRGSSVIPENGGGGSEEGGGTAVAAPIDVRYSVERINSVDYVTADQFQRGMQSAAAQGAKQGEQSTLKRLQMSGSTRRRLGL